MVDGALEVGKKYRGKIETVYGQYIRDQLSDPDKLDLSRAFLSHSGGGISEETLQAMKKEILRCAPFQEVQIIRAGCTISAHCGPKTATVMFMENKEFTYSIFQCNISQIISMNGVQRHGVALRLLFTKL